MLAEELRLKQSRERSANWQRWGPYLVGTAMGHGARRLLGFR